MTSLLSISGWMKIRLAGEQEFSLCYCHLYQDGLDVFNSETMITPKKSLEINRKTIISYNQENNSSEFCVNNEIFFRAKSPSEAFKWTSILSTLSFDKEPLSMSDFNIISVIGRGFFGKVMLVQRKTSKEVYALKTIRKKRLLDSGRPDTIITERNVMLVIRNPFLVHLHFSFQTQKKFYLGLDYAPGGDLFFRLSTKGPVPLQTARIYFAEIALALDSLHKCGVIYRDLKPENVLLDGNGHVLLTDFGLAKDLDYGQTTTTICGTEAYLAPEVVLGQPYDFAIDWWALGVLFCEMISGCGPFEGENKMKLYNSIANDPPTIPVGLDQDTAGIILMLLTKDPRNRPGFSDIKSHPFLAGLDWEKVREKRYFMDFVPETDTRLNPVYFDKEFTEERAEDSQSSASDDVEMRIDGFSFISRSVGSPSDPSTPQSHQND